MNITELTTTELATVIAFVVSVLAGFAVAAWVAYDLIAGGGRKYRQNRSERQMARLDVR
jgi:hypothetical protein